MRYGISEQQARQKLAEYGPNEITDDSYRSLSQIISAAVREPMVLMLISIGLIYIILGEIEESISLLTFLILILGITIYQERKTENTLAALKRLSSPRATVIRDGKRFRIASRELVPMDIVMLSEGDRVPADINLIEGGPLSVDESILTGESFPSNKTTKENENLIFSGSLIVRGQALGEVTTTGSKTEIGKIGISLKGLTEEHSRLQISTRKMVNKLFVFTVLLTFFVFIFYGLSNHEWLEALLAGLTLAMAILPNELPAVLLIFLSTGAWRISKQKVLTRKVSALESLGSITTLCVDKTGTLTINQMLVQSLYSADHELDVLEQQNVAELPEEFHEVLEFGILASKPDPYDPMEKSFHFAGKKYLRNTEHLHPQWTLFKEYPLTEDLLAVSYAWKPLNENRYAIGAKGAPEAIIDLCHLEKKQAEHIQYQVLTMAAKGLRVIAVAKANSLVLPSIQHDLDFEFVGLVGLADPVRSDAFSSVQECHRAGIKVMMITGDHPETAKSIGKQIGLENYAETLSGNELETLGDDDLIEKLKRIRIFCRMKPFHKNRIVTLLKKSGEVVAMTGDGVNDALALKNADVGIAMGERGTDVAREASSIVLLDDNFSSIVEAIRNGRRTFYNLQKAFSYLIAVHIPITAVSIIPVFFKLPLLLLPVHIAFLHLIIEPVSTIYFETEETRRDMMQIPPRHIDSPVLGRKEIFNSLFQGSWMTIIVLAVFAYALWYDHSPSDVRGLTFTTLIFSNLALIYTSGRQNRKKPLLILFLGTFMLLASVIYIPIIRNLFRFEILHPNDLLLCFSAGIVISIGLALSRHASIKD